MISRPPSSRSMAIEDALIPISVFTILLAILHDKAPSIAKTYNNQNRNKSHEAGEFPRKCIRCGERGIFHNCSSMLLEKMGCREDFNKVAKCKLIQNKPSWVASPQATQEGYSTDTNFDENIAAFMRK